MVFDYYYDTRREMKPKFPNILFEVEKKTLRKTSTRKFTWPGIEPGPAVGKVMGMDSDSTISYNGSSLFSEQNKVSLLMGGTPGDVSEEPVT